MTITEKFQRYHEKYPGLFTNRILPLVRQEIEDGHVPVSLRRLVKKLRRGGLGIGYATIPDNFAVEYARLIRELHPELAPFLKPNRLTRQKPVTAPTPVVA